MFEPIIVLQCAVARRFRGITTGSTGSEFPSLYHSWTNNNNNNNNSRHQKEVKYSMLAGTYISATSIRVAWPAELLCNFFY